MNAIPLEQAEQQAARRVSPLRVIDPAAWHGQPIPQRDWLVDGLIPIGAVTMLGGDGGLGKSLLMLQMQTATALGTPWLGFQTMPCKSFGLYCEDDEAELHRRMAAVLDYQRVPFTDLGGKVQFSSRVGLASEFLERDKYGKARGPSPVFFQVLDTVKRFGARLVILDGLHDLFDGNENSRPEARQFINLLRRIALEIHGAVLLCAHPSMAGLNSGSGTSGSTAWNNAVRSRLYLSRPKVEDGADDADNDVRIIKTMKSNYGRCGDSIKIRWKDGVFVQDEPEYQGGVFGAINRRNAEAAFLDGLRALEQSGTRVNTSNNTPNYGPRVIVRTAAAKGFTVKQLEAAMWKLLEQHRIGTREDGPASRRRTFLVAIDPPERGDDE